MAGTRGRRVAIGFMIVWLVFWGAGILVVFYGLGRAVWDGDLVGGLLMGLWLGAAVFGLLHGMRKLRQLTGVEAPPERASRAHVWRDAQALDPGPRRSGPPDA